MSEVVLSATPAQKEVQAGSPRRQWFGRLAGELATLFMALIALVLIAVLFLDSAPGHRFIVDRIVAMETASGLKIRIGRIDGSIFGRARLRNVAVSDKSGVFLVSPEIGIEWAPGAWLYNNLHIDRIEARRVTLLRTPKLISTGKPFTLPSFDLHLGRVAIDRLEVAQGVSGVARSGRLQGNAEVRAGRAMIALDLRLDGGGDRLALRLDSEPRRDRFDIGLDLVAPANGLVPALTGLRQPIEAHISGNGGWKRWAGAGTVDLSGKAAARLRLAVEDGEFQLGGTLKPADFLKGRFQRLSAPRIIVSGRGRVEGRAIEGQLRVSSVSVRAAASGGYDLATAQYRKLRLGVDLLRPAALLDDLRGRDIRLLWTLDGPAARADYAYRLTATELRFDQTGFQRVRAEGRGKLSPWPMKVPLRLTARSISGVGDEAGAILANARLQGMLELTPKRLSAERLSLVSDKLNGRVSLLVDFRTGQFEITLSGGLTRYAIPGLGIVDVTSALRAIPGPDGKGTRVVGTGKAWVRRLDNGFFRELTGGLPRIETRLERGPDKVLRFEGLELYSPGLRLSGRGFRRTNGSFHIEASGRQAKYGPVRMVLDGPIARPNIILLLGAPNEAMGLRAVRLSLVPSASGFDYRAEGGSQIGDFVSQGQILLPPGRQASVNIASLIVSGIRASGVLQAASGGIQGRLAVAGGGLNGELLFRPVGKNQRIEAHLDASELRLSGPPAFAVRSGRLDGVIILADGQTSLDGSLSARGVEGAGLTLARLTASGRLINGSGQVRASAAGRRGSAFELVTQAEVSPDRIVARGSGSVEGQPLQLLSPAQIQREGDGWRIAPTAVRFAGGKATVGGRTGSIPELTATLEAMPLGVLNIFRPRMDLGGTATGRIAYARPDGIPQGRVDLRVRGLSRAGLVLSSRPIDVGIAAALDGRQAAIRAVAVSDGRTLGRAQARFAPLGRGPIIDELRNAPLFAQLRYAGPADTLWRLTDTDILDVSGPVAIGVDIGGRLVAPQIRGSMKTTGARIESAVTGMVITDFATNGNFTGSRLDLKQLSGRTPGGGSITGSGTVDFSGGTPALDLSFQAKSARLLARDDISTDLTGPITIRSSGRGGAISGALRLDSGRFTLGRASTAASVPKLVVRHRGLDPDEVIEVRELTPWRLNLSVSGGELEVRGLGIDSRWTTNLKIGGSADSPRFVGTANLIRGNYEFAGRNFRLTRGLLRFRGESPPDPLLDIAAEAEVRGLDASVRVTGTGLKPEISFTSVPQLPQDELLSRMLFGTSIANLSAFEAIQLASAVAGLREGSGGLDPINAIRRTVGLDQLRILPADVATGQKTAISAGKYFGRKLFVEVITDGQGYSATRVEYQVTRWLSLLSSISTIGRTSVNVRVSKDY